MWGIIKRCFGFFSKDMGMDLGTCNTLVYVKGEGIVLSEPSVVAVKKGTNKVLLDGKAVGATAKEMIGKTPGNIVAVRPMRNGVIADFDVTEALISYFIQKVHNRRYGIMPRLVIAVPSGITGVEKRAVINSAERAGARQVFVVEEPMAAGIGAGLPMLDPIGNMIVDIGGGTTEVAVLSLGGIVASRSVRVAGDEFDEAIMQHLRRAYNLQIGEQTAERIKIEIGSLYPLEQELTLEVSGRDVMAMMPRKVTVTSEEVREAMKEPFEAILQAIKETLEETPPELAADLTERGITMAGGGSLIRGIDRAIRKEIDVPVRIAEDPLTCVARGTGLVIENLDRFKDALESDEDLA
ncbi:MAG TPA: rod shape-determining protein [Planctomycetota bacterium]|jgi:rod shape-determining protein MreB|nr:rod shape-determining protein [Planctomycetota bacterium]